MYDKRRQHGIAQRNHMAFRRRPIDSAATWRMLLKRRGDGFVATSGVRTATLANGFDLQYDFLICVLY